MMHIYRFFRALGRLLWDWLRWLPGFLLCLLWDHKVDRTPPHPQSIARRVTCKRCGACVVVWYARS
jgi:hypothetical protein